MSGAWLLAAVPVLALWGTWGVFAKLATSSLGWKTAWMVQAGAEFCVYAIAFGILRPPLSGNPGKGMLFAILAGVCGPLGSMLFYLAISRAKTASVVVPLTALYPVVTIAILYLVLNERVPATKGVGILLAIAAGLLLSL